MSTDDNKIRNIGSKSAAWLRQVGIHTQQDLVRLGAVEAFLKVKRAGFKPSRNLLYAMAGALEDCRWTELGDVRKQALIDALEAAEAINPIQSRWDKAAERSARVDGTMDPDLDRDAEAHDTGYAETDAFDEPDSDE